MATCLIVRSLCLLRSLLPHLADDIAEPIVTMSGDVPDAIVAMVRTEIERLQSFYLRSIEAGAAAGGLARTSPV